MDKEIKDLIDYISKSNFIEFELEKDGLKLKLVKGTPKDRISSTDVQSSLMNQSAQEGQPSEGEQRNAKEMVMVLEESESKGSEEELFEVKSPIVGTFYRAPNPKAPPYVEVGDIVKKGQVLCIVEAMKLMNEIEADISGEMVEILVPNAHPVEYGQVLFRIRPAE